MKVFYSSLQKKHVIKKEVYNGKAHSYNDKVSRIDSILKAFKSAGNYEIVVPDILPYDALLSVHDEDYLKFLESAQNLKNDEIICPYVFPCDNRISRYEPFIPKRAGYYCFDAGTSLMNHTWSAAVASASAAYSAAIHTKKTGEATYALCRPPGHHASKNMFGGYCYLNNTAIAAKYLVRSGNVMIIDFDFHHGNGTQSIFYDSSDIFYLSIHAHPKIEYPYFTGFEDEIGIDDGVNYNLNIPLMPLCSPKEYFIALQKGIKKAFKIMDPDYIILSAGFDIEAGDPIGHFNMSIDDFYILGKELKLLNKPTIILQEGGYLVSELGKNVESFLNGFQS
ncbi:histone deacetylase family protein [Fluviispira vulneris]|uniref:histone deacetylase family protein n=1 Tax=Fluviispira vulneris TaxID=2763012 RepID=UPI0016489957|nr:histone deacetylase family protein [Fluviispira vulneris]